MAQASSPEGFSQQIEQLLADRREHVAAIAHIDSILAGVGDVLTGLAERSRLLTSAVSAARAVPAPVAASAAPAKASAPVKVAAPAKAKGKAGRGRGGRGKFAQSGEEFIVAYVKAHKSATTREINDAWKAEGRAGSADNALGKLVRERRLVRSKIKGERGSKFAAGK